MLHRMTPKESDISTPLAPDSTPLIAVFAQRELNGHDDLRDHDIMPAALWQAIGAAGLAQIGLPVEYGGTGGGFRNLASAAETLSAEGGIKGVTTSWLGRQLISRLLILGHGNEAQRREYLPDLAAGRLTPSLAISEPGAGAHPKHLQTTAERAGDGFILNGEKAYVTNGPIADVFLVMAITATHESRKRYSILIVPRNTPGLTLTEGVKIDFLHPAPHCGLRFKDVHVPHSNLLGREGSAFEEISLPMRRVEDALAIASIAGATRHQIARLAAENKGHAFDETSLTELGTLATMPDGLSALSGQAAEGLDQNIDPETLNSIAAAAKDWARTIQERIRALIDQSGISLSTGLAAECHDIEKSLGIARSAHIVQSQRRARALLASSAFEKH